MNSKNLYIYNSLTSSKEKFKPLKNNRKKIWIEKIKKNYG